MISKGFMTGTGLKKWVPINFSGRLVMAAISVMDNPEVFVKKGIPVSQFPPAPRRPAS
jgi:hypothetical protein